MKMKKFRRLLAFPLGVTAGLFVLVAAGILVLANMFRWLANKAEGQTRYPYKVQVKYGRDL